MADNQVLVWFILSIREPSKNKKMFSSTARNSLPRKLAQVSDTSKTLDWDSKHPRKLLNPSMLIRNAPSPAVFLSEVKY